MVIDAQLDFSHQILGLVLEHAGCGHVNADDAVPGADTGGTESLVEPLVFGADAFVFQHMGGFPQLAQPQAQGGGGADGIAVRAGMGEDDVMVMGGQKCGCFSSRQYFHL